MTNKMRQTVNGLRGEALELLLKLSGAGKTIFTVQEAQALTDLPPDHLNTLLYRLAQKQWLKRLERGTYLIVPLEAGLDREWSADPFLVASYLADPCAIGYWSALSHWNLTEQLPRAVYVQTTDRKHQREKHVLSFHFIFVTLSEHRFFGFRPQWFDGHRVQVTDVEKTLVDCLDRTDLCGGVVEAAKGVRIAWQEGRLESDKLISYALRMGNRAVIKRFGFIVETLGLATPQETEPWRAQLSRGYSPLDPQLPREGRYDSRWQVLVNLDPAAFQSGSPVSLRESPG